VIWSSRRIFRAHSFFVLLFAACWGIPLWKTLKYSVFYYY
jgi:hypothetical protein